MACKLRKKLMAATDGVNNIGALWSLGYMLREAHCLALKLAA